MPFLKIYIILLIINLCVSCDYCNTVSKREFFSRFEGELYFIWIYIIIRSVIFMTETFLYIKLIVL